MPTTFGLRTPKRRFNPTAVCDRDLGSEITMAPKKRRPENLVRFLQDDKDAEEYEWSLSDGRVGGYVFFTNKACMSICIR